MVWLCVSARGAFALVAILVGGMLAPVLAAAAGAAPLASGSAVLADHHLQAARRQSGGDPARPLVFRRACGSSAAPSSITLAEQALRQAEAEHRRERAHARPDAARLLQAWCCAAYHATRLQPGVSYPMWLVQLPAVAIREAPVFASAAALPTPLTPMARLAR